nr:nucleotidyltransferase family protein [Sphingomonas sp. Y57]
MASEPIPVGGLAPALDNSFDRAAATEAATTGIDRRAEHALLLSLLGSALDGVARPMPPRDDRFDWDELIGMAARGRLLAQVQRGLLVSGIAAPPRVGVAIKAFRQRSLMINSVNLSTVQRVSGALDAASIGFVVLKGPLLLRALYDDYFTRPSSDLDLLVDRHDYDRAAGVLRSLGYAPADRCESRWWLHYLGEQHFLPPGRSLATVDLHHRVQQPGCPAPRELASYIGNGRRMVLGSTAVPVLSPIHACLLAAIGFVKAAFHREHSLRYLTDLAAQLLAMSEQERHVLDVVARAQGIRHLLAFAWDCAGTLLPVPLPAAPVRRPMRSLATETLAAMSLSPEDPAIAWPKRRHLLWHLCDPGTPFGRIGTFAGEAGFAAAAEVSRLVSR